MLQCRDRADLVHELAIPLSGPRRELLHGDYGAIGQQTLENSTLDFFYFLC